MWGDLTPASWGNSDTILSAVCVVEGGKDRGWPRLRTGPGGRVQGGRGRPICCWGWNRGTEATCDHGLWVAAAVMVACSWQHQGLQHKVTGMPKGEGAYHIWSFRWADLQDGGSVRKLQPQEPGFWEGVWHEQDGVGG